MFAKGDLQNMNKKRLISATLCSTMILSLVACNPKEAITNIISGNSNNGNNTTSQVAVSDKVNKDAVFKEVGRFNLEGYEYVDYLSAAGNKYYVAQMVYDYPEGFFDGYDGNPVLYDSEIPEDAEDVDAEDVDTEEINDEDVNDEDYTEEYDDIKAKLRIASFTNMSDVSYLDIEWPGNEYTRGYVGVDKDGNMYLTSSVWNQETETEESNLIKLAPDGTEIARVPITGEGYYYVSSMATDTNGNSFLVSENAVDIYDANLQKTGTYKFNNESYVSAAFVNEKGDFVLQLEDWSSEKTVITLLTIDTKGNAKEHKDIINMLNGQQLIDGIGYDYFYRTSTSVFAFNDGDKSAKEVVNFYDSDIDPDETYGLLRFTDTEHFIVVSNNKENPEVSFYEKVPAEDVKDKEIITLGTVWGAYGVSSQVVEFNKSNDQYRIKIVDYSEFSTPDDWMGGVRRFNADITGGNCPDIIIPEATDIKNFIDKGVFADLTPIMAASDGVKKEDFVYNAQTIFAEGDSLYVVYPNFNVEALEIKKSAYKPNMTFADVKAWEAQTGSKAFYQDTRRNVLTSAMSMSMDAFLDPETGKCSFDSPEFIEILEYANTYPEEYSDDQLVYDYNEYQMCFRSDKALFSDSYIYDFRDYNWNRAYRFGEDTVLMGMPVNGSQGAVLMIDTPMGISAKSNHKEAAWDFMKTCFSDEYYEDNGWGLPSVESQMDKKIEEATKKQTYETDDGKIEEITETMWIMDEEVEVPPMTKEEAAALKDFVTHVTNIYMWDEELNNIVDEETQAYFQGQKSADEVSKVIQSRLQIYINEKK